MSDTENEQMVYDSAVENLAIEINQQSELDETVKKQNHSILDDTRNADMAFRSTGTEYESAAENVQVLGVFTETDYASAAENFNDALRKLQDEEDKMEYETRVLEKRYDTLELPRFATHVPTPGNLLVTQAEGSHSSDEEDDATKNTSTTVNRMSDKYTYTIRLQLDAAKRNIIELENKTKTLLALSKNQQSLIDTQREQIAHLISLVKTENKHKDKEHNIEKKIITIPMHFHGFRSTEENQDTDLFNCTLLLLISSSTMRYRICKIRNRKKKPVSPSVVLLYNLMLDVYECTTHERLNTDLLWNEYVRCSKLNVFLIESFFTSCMSTLIDNSELFWKYTITLDATTCDQITSLDTIQGVIIDNGEENSTDYYTYTCMDDTQWIIFHKTLPPTRIPMLMCVNALDELILESNSGCACQFHMENDT